MVNTKLVVVDSWSAVWFLWLHVDSAMSFVLPPVRMRSIDKVKDAVLDRCCPQVKHLLMFVLCQFALEESLLAAQVVIHLLMQLCKEFFLLLLGIVTPSYASCG